MTDVQATRAILVAMVFGFAMSGFGAAAEFAIVDTGQSGCYDNAGFEIECSMSAPGEMLLTFLGVVRPNGTRVVMGERPYDKVKKVSPGTILWVYCQIRERTYLYI